MSFRRLHRAGVLGINRRNVDYTLRWNDRRLYPRVDDKLATKGLCQRAGIPVPRLLAVARRHHEVRPLVAQLESYESFVLKPARGTMGNGIVVIVGVETGLYRSAGGRPLTPEELRYHAAGIISGLYSLGGHLDAALVEERLVVHPEMAGLVAGGVPDVRVIVYRGVPVMAMTRLPTRRSGGRANLHQGAIGAGIDLAEGRTCHAVLGREPIDRHPDTGRPVVAQRIPDFGRILEIAVRATDTTGLGYVGADVVVDASQGPMVLELNARPGLAIQLANAQGLRPRLEAVDRDHCEGRSVSERVALGSSLARVAEAARGRTPVPEEAVGSVNR